MAGLSLVNIRHAHTHLMYFAWATPAVFALISAHVAVTFHRDVPRLSTGSMIACLILGLAAYGSFLLFGYQPVPMGSAQIPPSVVIAGLNMIAWYGFVVGYRRQTKGITRTKDVRLIDTSLVFLVLASIGAWGISMIAPLGLQGELWPSIMTHVFLEFFTEGWLLLAVLGLLVGVLKKADNMPPRSRDASRFRRLFDHLWDGPSYNLATGALVTGICLSVLLGMPRTLIPLPAQILARAGGFFMGLGLIVFIRSFWRVAGPHRTSSIFLFLKVFVLSIVCVTPMIWWSEYHAELIFYLHLHLLGFVSIGIVLVAEQMWYPDLKLVRTVFVGVVILVLASLLPMTFVLPSMLKGAWMMYVMALAAPLPALVALVMLVRR